MSKTAQPAPIWLVLPQALLPQALWQHEDIHFKLQQHTQHWPKPLLQCLATCPITPPVAYHRNQWGQTHWAEGLMWQWLMGTLHNAPLTDADGVAFEWAMLSKPQEGKEGQTPQAPVPTNTRFLASAIHLQLHPQGCDVHHALLGNNHSSQQATSRQAEYWACVAPVLQAHGFSIIKQWGWDALVTSQTPMDLNTCSPWSAQQTNITDILCNREQPSLWRKLWMEVQMALHTHNTSQPQPDTADLPNGIWLWGNGKPCTTQWLLPQLKPVHHNLDPVDCNSGKQQTSLPDHMLNVQALQYWHDLCHNLLFKHNAAETIEDEEPKTNGVWYCIDNAQNPSIWHNLNEQIIKPMQHSGITLGWLLCGEFGFKSLQPGFWHKLNRIWQRTPQWQHLQDAPQNPE